MISDSSTILQIWPEIALAALAVWIYVGNAVFRPKLNAQTRMGWTAFAVAAVALAWFALSMWQGPEWRRASWAPSSGPLAVDYFAYAMRSVALLAGLLLVLQSSRAADAELHCEYLGTLLLAVVGVMLTASAGELIFLFLGLEMISIPTYVLLFLGRRDNATAEATVKYFFLSIVSSAMLLYGFSLLYGMTGTTSLAEIRLKLEALRGATEGLAVLGPAALVLIFAGLGFKIAAAPFHFYAPDVYQGATTGNASLLSVLPKIAGIVALARLVGVAMPALGDFTWQLAVVLSILTMTLGNVSALWQTNVRRLMAYSSIAHSGYMLIGLAVALAPGESGAEHRGLSAMILYLFVYVFATLGTFAVLTHLGSRDRDLNNIDELAGLGRSRPVTAAILAICMFSLSGIPPLAGFWGKLVLFGGAVRLAFDPNVEANVQTWFIVLSIVGVLNAAVAAAYYLRVVAVMYFRPQETAPAAQGGFGAWSAAAAAGAITVAIGLFPGTLIENSRRAEYAARGENEPALEAYSGPSSPGAMEARRVSEAPPQHPR